MNCPHFLTLEEFAWQCEWMEAIRLSQFVSEPDATRAFLKIIRRAKRADAVFTGPYGDMSEWAGMVRRWYGYYLLERAA